MEMAILWGYKLEEATVNIWEKTSVKVVEVGHAVREKIEDVIGEENLEAAGEAGIKIRDGTVKAWDTVSTETMEFEEKVRETTTNTKAGKLGAKWGNRWKNKHQKSQQENGPKDSVDDSETISLAAASTSVVASTQVQEYSKYQYLSAIIFGVVVLIILIAVAYIVIPKVRNNQVQVRTNACYE